MPQTATEKRPSLQEFCRRYFIGVGAVSHPAPDDVICVELPRDVDKELTDRPFYWMWVAAMNENPPPTVLYLKFSPAADESAVPERARPELIAPGCYRMLRIMASAKARGAFAAAYESESLVTPYALFVVKVSFMCDLRQDFLESYAIDLRDLRIYGNAMEKLADRELVDERPRQTRIMPIPVDADQLFRVLFECVRLDVKRRDDTWAREAERRLADELRRLDQYYDSLENSAESPGGPAAGAPGANGPADAPEEERGLSRAAERELRRAEIVWRTEPKIEIRPSQFALVYLSRPPV